VDNRAAIKRRCSRHQPDVRQQNAQAAAVSHDLAGGIDWEKRNAGASEK
jgi:hypothetical protein